MNRHTDIDRTLEVFFLDGPSLMPDRLFEAVLDRVERVPQRRLARLKLRFTDMTTTVRWVAAGAAAVLVVGVGFAALGRGPAETPGAIPSPSISPPASPQGSPVPEVLRHPMLAEHRATAPAPAGQDRSIIQFGASTFLYNEGLLHSTASSAEADQIRLVSDRANGCDIGDEGSYSWSATPGATIVTFTLLQDDCDARAAVIPGEWLRSDCDDPQNFCLGPLEAGRYASHYIDPFVPTGGQWQPRFGAITYDVPEGWENRSDYPAEYQLELTDRVGSGIYLRSDVVAASDPCSEAADPSVGTTATEIGAWLGGLPGVVATEPVATTIGGLTGVRLDLSLDPAWAETCEFSDGKPFRMLFVDTDPGSGYAWGLVGEGRMRVFLLDLGADRTMLVDIEGLDEASHEGILDEAMAIVESMQFNR